MGQGCQRTSMHIRSKIASGVSREGLNIPHIGIVIGTYHTRDWCAWKESCGCGKHTCCIPHCINGWGWHHVTVSKTGVNNAKYRTKHLPNVHYDLKQTDGPKRKISEVTLQAHEEGTIILWEAGIITEVNRVHCQPILYMFNQRGGKCKADDHTMACRWLKILHICVDRKVIDWTKGIYGSHMKESCGKKIYYLGVYLDF